MEIFIECIGYTRSLQSTKSDKGAINSLKDLMNTDIDLNLQQDGDTILLPQRIRLHLRHRDGNQTATCGQHGTGIRGNLLPGVNSEFFSSSIVPDKWFLMLRAGNLISWQSTEGVNSTAHTFFLKHSLLACLSQLVVTVVQVHTAT